MRLCGEMSGGFSVMLMVLVGVLCAAGRLLTSLGSRPGLQDSLPPDVLSWLGGALGAGALGSRTMWMSTSEEPGSEVEGAAPW